MCKSQPDFRTSIVNRNALYSRNILGSVVVVIGYILLAVSNTIAATFIVSNTNDNGPGSLRQAISEANTNTQADMIVFDSDTFSSPQVILLTSGELVIQADLNLPMGISYALSIIGPGPDLLTIDANGQSRVFFSENGNYKFTLAGMTLTNGYALRGGAIYARSYIEAAEMVITDSVAEGYTDVLHEFPAGAGGGIFAAGGIAIRRSTLNNNIAKGLELPNHQPADGTAGLGGGIYSSGSIVDCTFTNNVARGISAPEIVGPAFGGDGGGAYGGAVYSNTGGNIIINSRFIHNGVIAGHGATVGSGTAGDGGGAQGGAIRSSSDRILNSVFVDNFVTAGQGGVSPDPIRSGEGGDAAGGAIFESGNGRMANLTIAENIVSAGNGRVGGIGMGGGLYLGDNQWNLVNLTITDNFVTGGTGTQTPGSGQGGGVFSRFQSVPPTPNFRNNIVADNTAPSGKDIYGFFPGSFNNLIGVGDGSSGMTNGTNVNLMGSASLPLDPMLGPLSDNGGVTDTRALLDGSPAINAGNASVFNPILFPQNSFPLLMDQRNFPRISPIGGSIDIGAYEFGSPQIPLSTSTPDL